MRLSFCLSARKHRKKPVLLCVILRFSRCPSVLECFETVSLIERAWETRLERENPGYLAVRAVTVPSAAIIPQLLIVPPTWYLLQLEGVFCSMYVYSECERVCMCVSMCFVCRQLRTFSIYTTCAYFPSNVLSSMYRL